MHDLAIAKQSNSNPASANRCFGGRCNRHAHNSIQCVWNSWPETWIHWPYQGPHGCDYLIAYSLHQLEGPGHVRSRILNRNAFLRVSHTCANLKGLDMYTDATQDEHLQIDFKNNDADNFWFDNLSHKLHFLETYVSPGKIFSCSKLTAFIPDGKIIEKLRSPRWDVTMRHG